MRRMRALLSALAVQTTLAQEEDDASTMGSALALLGTQARTATHLAPARVANLLATIPKASAMPPITPVSATPRSMAMPAPRMAAPTTATSTVFAMAQRAAVASLVGGVAIVRMSALEESRTHVEACTVGCAHRLGHVLVILDTSGRNVSKPAPPPPRGWCATIKATVLPLGSVSARLAGLE